MSASSPDLPPKKLELSPEETAEESPLRLNPETFQRYETRTAEGGDLILEQVANVVDEDEELSSHKAQKITFKQLSITILIIVLFVGGIVVMSVIDTEEETVVEDPLHQMILEGTQRNTSSAAKPVEVRVNHEGIMALLKAFNEADSVDALLAISRPFPRAREIMEAYYSDSEREMPSTLPDVQSFEISSTCVLYQISYQGVNVQLKNGNKQLVVIVYTPSGPKIDWESTVFYQEIPWKKLLSGDVNGSFAMRCTVRPDTLYIDPFNDSDYLCLRLTARDLAPDAVCFAYLPWDSPTIEMISPELDQWTRVGTTPAELIVELSYVEKTSLSHLLRIDKIISPTWVHPHRERENSNSPKPE